MFLKFWTYCIRKDNGSKHLFHIQKEVVTEKDFPLQIVADRLSANWKRSCSSKLLSSLVL